MTSLAEQLRAELGAMSPEERAQLVAAISPETVSAGEPAKPPTLLDDVRHNPDSLDLLHTEIPSVNELPPLVGVLVKAYHALADQVAQLHPSSEPPLGAGEATPDSAPASSQAAPPDRPVAPPGFPAVEADPAGNVQDNPVPQPGTGFAEGSS